MNDSPTAWYRQNVCRRLAHTHDEAGELACMLATLGRLKAGEEPMSLLGLGGHA